MSLNLLCAIALTNASLHADTVTPLSANDTVPQTAEALWRGYDPRVESLDVEVLHEWEEEGVVMQVLRYRVGVFKGEKAMLAAIYGYPKGASDLPGLVQIHGGGQYADYRAVLTNAKRGYATLSIAWAGRINAPDYTVNPNVTQLFFDGKTEHPDYKLTTDWGALEGYHAPSRFKSGNVHNLVGAEWTIDPIDSPRNSAWYLWTMGARRGLTFLEQRAEVDGDRLGVYGHSMGGKITVLTAGSDKRVKAAAPSCGGLSNRADNTDLYNATIGDDAYLKQITCPTFFLSPANDFHGLINHVPLAVQEMQTDEWRVNSAPHHCHMDTAAYEVATQLWMDQYLKAGMPLPKTPEAQLDITLASGVPTLTVQVDGSMPIAAIEVYYTQQGQAVDEDYDRLRTIHRYWHYVAVTEVAGEWVAELPVFETDQPLWAYANVVYELETPVSGAGYYYGDYTAEQYVLSSLVQIASADALQAAGVRAVLEATAQVENFKGDWQKGWFKYSNDPEAWQINTHKVYDPMYSAPEYAKLAFEVRADSANTLVVGLNDGASEVVLEGGAQWQQVVLYPTDFKTADGAFGLNWKGLMDLRLTDFEHLRSSTGGDALAVGAKKWQGSAPEFRNLRWESGTREELNARRTNKLIELPVEDGKVYLNFESADEFSDGYKSVMNEWLDGEPLEVEGVSYARGMTTHASANALYFLNGEFKRFKAIAQAGQSALVSFEVYVDDALVCDSGALTSLQFKMIDLDLTGAAELRLVVTDGGNGIGGDHASWIDAHLIK